MVLCRTIDYFYTLVGLTIEKCLHFNVKKTLLCQVYFKCKNTS